MTRYAAGMSEIIVPATPSTLGFPLLLLYPALSQVETYAVGPYVFDASPSASRIEGRHPLVIISHGSGGSNVTHRGLASFLAKNGFIVALPEHPLNNRSNNERHDTIENLSERPLHISETINCLLASDVWSISISADEIFVIGHSMGAYTALAAAGGLAHTQHQINHDPSTRITESRAIVVEKDGRIKALVLFAAAAGWFSSEGALMNVDVPVLLYSAELDSLTPLFHAEIIMRGLPDRSRVTHKKVANAGHFSFLTPFPEKIKAAGLPPAIDPQGFNREIFHEELYAEILDFLKKSLA